eukprot:SAG31_NODE_2513_length_5583_cov_1.886397_4_plen_148_part_00
MLSQIKAEYDRHLRIKGRELEEARFLLRKKPALEEQTASIADAIRDQSAMSNHALHSALQEEIEKKKGLDTALQQQNAKLAKVQAELAAVNEEKKNMQVIYSDLNRSALFCTWIYFGDRVTLFVGCVRCGTHLQCHEHARTNNGCAI